MKYRLEKGSIYTYEYLPNNLKISPQSSLKSLSVKKTSLTDLSSLKDMRCKSKRKLKFELFKIRDHMCSPKNQSSQLQQYYSYYGAKLQPALSETKTSIHSAQIKGDQVQHPKRHLIQTLTHSHPHPDKKQKREFKLIHQIKKQKKQKLVAEPMPHHPLEQSLVFHQQVQLIAQQIGKSKESELFELQLKSLLQPEIVLQKKKYFPSEQKNIEKVKQQAKDEIKILKISQISASKSSRIFKKSQIKPIGQSINLKENEEIMLKKPDILNSIVKIEKLKQQISRKRKNTQQSIEIDLKQSGLSLQMSLGLESKRDSKIRYTCWHDMSVWKESERLTTEEKINLHLEVIESLSNYIHESMKFDVSMTEEWQELNFLIYKKYYLERLKVIHFMKRYPMKNPFFLQNININAKQVIDFMKTTQGLALKTKINSENVEIKQKLITFYNHFPKEKVGEKINLYEYDNFSHWILEELWAQLILTEYNTEQTQQNVNIRLCRILQSALLISELNGKMETSFENGQKAIQTKQYHRYIEEQKHTFSRYILQQE